MVVDAPNWVFEDMNEWMRSFFYAGKDKSNGGQFLVAWDMICRTMCYGDLGVKNLRLQALMFAGNG